MGECGSFILLHVEGNFGVDSNLGIYFLALAVFCAKIIDLVVNFGMGGGVACG